MRHWTRRALFRYTIFDFFSSLLCPLDSLWTIHFSYHDFAVRLASMRFDIITIFPEFFGGPLDYGIVRRAREARLIEIHIHDLRDFTHDRHRTVDDRPFGGGEGMVMKPEPLFETVE